MKACCQPLVAFPGDQVSGAKIAGYPIVSSYPRVSPLCPIGTEAEPVWKGACRRQHPAIRGRSLHGASDGQAKGVSSPRSTPRFAGAGPGRKSANFSKTAKARPPGSSTGTGEGQRTFPITGSGPGTRGTAWRTEFFQKRPLEKTETSGSRVAKRAWGALPRNGVGRRATCSSLRSIRGTGSRWLRSRNKSKAHLERRDSVTVPWLRTIRVAKCCSLTRDNSRPDAGI